MICHDLPHVDLTHSRVASSFSTSRDFLLHILTYCYPALSLTGAQVIGVLFISTSTYGDPPKPIIHGPVIASDLRADSEQTFSFSPLTDWAQTRKRAPVSFRIPQVTLPPNILLGGCCIQTLLYPHATLEQLLLFCLWNHPVRQRRLIFVFYTPIQLPCDPLGNTRYRLVPHIVEASTPVRSLLGLVLTGSRLSDQETSQGDSSCLLLPILDYRGQTSSTASFTFRAKLVKYQGA
ncbi:hypothetical protein F5Y06DRAFT_38247 [Hypoxylon sp. FL0890]|nr:hypothetical protein F5Y06DRAFT_38247 [Hypoxylon sp. FL0890]